MLFVAESLVVTQILKQLFPELLFPSFQLGEIG